MTKRRKNKDRLALRFSGDDGSRSGVASPPSPVSPVNASEIIASPLIPLCDYSLVSTANLTSSNPLLCSNSDLGHAPLSDFVEEINQLSCFAPISGVNSSYAHALLRVAPGADEELSSSADGPCLLGLHNLDVFPSLSSASVTRCSPIAKSVSSLPLVPSVVCTDLNLQCNENINSFFGKQPEANVDGNNDIKSLSGNNVPPIESVRTSPSFAWTSLFNKLPPNAGSYIPKVFETLEEDGILIPPQEVIDAGHVFWKDYVVGFFLDQNPAYDLVRAHCRRAWKLKGGLRVHYDNSMFYFHFNIPEERQRILESPPTIIQGKPFIITPWSPSVDAAREQAWRVGDKIWEVKGEAREEAKNAYLDILKVLETELGDKKYFGGETFNYVDIIFCPYNVWMYTYEQHANFSAEKEIPKLVAYANRCLERPSVAKTLPDPKRTYEYILDLKKKLGIE